MTYPQDCFVARHCIIQVLRRLKVETLPEIPIQSADADDADDVETEVLFVTNPIHRIQTPGNNRRELNETAIVHLPPENNDADESISPINHVGITVALWLLTVIVAIFSSDLGIVNTLNGALAGSMLGFILPAAFYLKSHEEDIKASYVQIVSNDPSTWGVLRGVLKNLSTACFCCGCIVAGISFSVIGLLSVALNFYWSPDPSIR
jgi:hypothetical protein